MFRNYCNDIFLLYKPIASEFITSAWNNFFVVAIAPYCKDFVLTAMIFSIVINLFSCGVICLNHVKYRHVNALKKHIEHMTEYKIRLFLANNSIVRFLTMYQT